jgi:hypothetical protein
MRWATFWATFFHKLIWSPCPSVKQHGPAHGRRKFLDARIRLIQSLYFVVPNRFITERPCRKGVRRTNRPTCCKDRLCLTHHHEDVNHRSTLFIHPYYLMQVFSCMFRFSFMTYVLCSPLLL